MLVVTANMLLVGARIENISNSNTRVETINKYDFSGMNDNLDWPTLQGNYQRTGYSDGLAPNTNHTLWKYEVGDVVGSSPLVAEGKVVVGSINGYIYCLDEGTGELIWKYLTDYVYCTGTIANGKVFIGSGGDFYCLDLDTGQLYWKFIAVPPGGYMRTKTYSSAVYFNGTVIVGAYDGCIYSLYEDNGDIKWSYLTTNDTEVRSTSFSNGKIYAAGLDSNVYCLNAETGKLIWINYNVTSEQIKSEITIDNDKIYFGSDDHNLYCLDANSGEMVWNYETEGKIHSSPAIAYGNIYIGSMDWNLSCLDKENGSLKWKYQAVWEVKCCPAVADGKVYFGVSDWWETGHNNSPATFPVYFYCVNAFTGELIWKYQTGDWTYSSPAIANAKVIVGSHDGYVYAFSCPIEILDISGGLRRIGVSTAIKNIGTEYLTNVYWEITIEAPIIWGGKTSGTIVNITAGEEMPIKSKFLLGFGPCTIIVTADCAIKTAKGFLLGPFIFGIK